MFERFDDAARRVIVLTQDEARKLNHHFIGTEHLLLALMREGHGAAAAALTGLGLSYDAVLARVDASLGRGATPTPSHLPFTEGTKRAIEHGFEASLGRGDAHIGTEHLLLGLVRDDNEATAMLADLGVDAQRVRDSLGPDDQGRKGAS
jgi:ATP-dependent Clp protease ATP-binding subunit ClpC